MQENCFIAQLTMIEVGMFVAVGVIRIAAYDASHVHISIARGLIFLYCQCLSSACRPEAWNVFTAKLTAEFCGVVELGEEQ